MANRIRVTCTDGTIELGGRFEDALATVKAVSGRKYDGATKVWTVPVQMAQVPGPWEALQGSESLPTGTRRATHGNLWTPQEQAEDVEQRRQDDLYWVEQDRKEETAVDELRIALAAAGCDLASLEKLVLHHARFEELVEQGIIHFTDEAKAQRVRRAFAAFDVAMR